MASSTFERHERLQPWNGSSYIDPLERVLKHGDHAARCMLFKVRARGRRVHKGIGNTCFTALARRAELSSVSTLADRSCTAIFSVPRGEEKAGLRQLRRPLKTYSLVNRAGCDSQDVLFG